MTFSFPDKRNKALQNISFEIEKGKKLGITGTTGSGKSTLTSLLLRQYENFQGKIMMDQKEVRMLDKKHYLQTFGYVPQDLFLFSDTILNNLAFGIDSSEIVHEKIIEVCKICALHRDIIDFPKQYETLIGERGINLSGGQNKDLHLQGRY